MVSSALAQREYSVWVTAMSGGVDHAVLQVDLAAGMRGDGWGCAGVVWRAVLARADDHGTRFTVPAMRPLSPGAGDVAQCRSPPECLIEATVRANRPSILGRGDGQGAGCLAALAPKCSPGRGDRPSRAAELGY